MDKGSTPGQMEGSTKVNPCSRATYVDNNAPVNSCQVNGKSVNIMERASIPGRVESGMLVNGRKANTMARG